MCRMKAPISHTLVEKLVSLLEECYIANIKIDPELWSDFNLVAIARELLEADHHRESIFIDISDRTADWIETIAELSNNPDDDDIRLVAAFTSTLP